MPDSRPLDTSSVAKSGADLNLTYRGLLEKIERGDLAAKTNLILLLDALTGPERDKWMEKCPSDILRLRMALLKLGSEEQLACERIALDHKKLAPTAPPITPTADTHIHVHPPVSGTDKLELEAKRRALEAEAEGVT